MKFSISTTLLALTIGSAGLALAIGANEWYRSNYSGHAMCDVVDTIRNGHSLQSVKRKFHGFTEVGQDDDFVQNIWGQRQWPIESNDKFYHFLFDGEFGIYLQFRDNKVINHTDKFFHDDVIRQMKNNSVPPSLFGFGIRPVQYGILLITLTGIILCFWLRKNSVIPTGSNELHPTVLDNNALNTKPE